MPKYLSIYKTLKSRIQNSIYPEHSILLPENALADEFKVSRITIRNALSKLISEGYLETIQGKGHVILKKENNVFIVDLHTENLLIKKYTKVMLSGSHIIKPTIDLVYQLQVDPNSRIVNIIWKFYCSKEIVAVEIQYIPYFPGITLWNNNFDYTGFEDIMNKRNQSEDLTRIVTIKAVKCPENIKNYLELQQNSPIMQITQKISDEKEILGLKILNIKEDWCCVPGNSFSD